MAKQKINTAQQADIKRQNDTTNTSVAGARIETGWGFINGNNTSVITKDVTFSTPFTTVPIITVSPAGGKLSINGSYPDTGNFYVDNIYAAVSSQTTSSFKCTLVRAGGVTAGSTTCAYFTWIAIGV